MGHVGRHDIRIGAAALLENRVDRLADIESAERQAEKFPMRVMRSRREADLAILEIGTI
jgi:hypothetical protein